MYELIMRIHFSKNSLHFWFTPGLKETFVSSCSYIKGPTSDSLEIEEFFGLDTYEIRVSFNFSGSFCFNFHCHVKIAILKKDSLISLAQILIIAVQILE